MTTLPAPVISAADIVTAAPTHENDQPLHSRVLQALATQTHLVGKNLRFETRAGRVTIHGKVRSYFLKQMAQETLKGIEGLHHIDNQMVVDWEHDTPAMQAAFVKQAN
jgi:osmotically-inducible protein OsmY